MAALCEVEGICHELQMATFFEHFQHKAKRHQLFVRMPNTAALIYANNNKPGCFTGFIKEITLRRPFKYD